MATGQHFTLQHVTYTTRLPSSSWAPAQISRLKIRKAGQALHGAANEGLPTGLSNCFRAVGVGVAA